jgi:hypothetical protein
VNKTLKDEKDKALEKIMKLLELGTSDNMNEAKLAMERAGELMAKFNLSKSDVDAEKEEVIEFPMPQMFGGTSKLWELYLANCIAIPFHCRVIHSRNGDNKIIHIFGEEPDLRIVLHFYFYLHAKMQKEATNNKIRTRQKPEFYHGVIDVVKSRLVALYNARKNVMSTRGDEIVLSKKHKVDIAVKSAFPNLTSGFGPRLKRGAEYGKGKEAGRNINLFQPIRKTVKAIKS